MRRAAANPIVHLELHTGNLPRACAFYTRLFGWRAETVRRRPRARTSRSAWATDRGRGRRARHGASLWLPYVEVADVAEATERARRLGASVLLEPREGPAGWRSVVAAPAGAEIALWQPKA